MTDSYDNLLALWPNAKNLLRSTNSTAQLYVLDISTRDLPACIKHYSHSTIDPAVETLNDQRFATDSTAPPFNKVAEVLYTHSDSIGLAVLNGTLASGEMLNLWLKRNDDEDTFDAELVFWADQICRSGRDDADCMATFQPIFAMAEQFRINSPGSPCLLSTSEASDPRAELDEPWTITW